MLEEQVRSILQYYHSRKVGGQVVQPKLWKRYFNHVFIGTLFKYAYTFVATCDRCLRTSNISKKNEILLYNILKVEF